MFRSPAPGAHGWTIERPSDLAVRLPKALIRRNIPGQSVHALLRDFDAAWNAAAPLSSFGPRQRWTAACVAPESSWPVRNDGARQGELTVEWAAVAPS
jgi:hypothetical protein